MAVAKLVELLDAQARTTGVAPGVFRKAMRELASGVALLTAANERARAGCAVTSLASLSLSPASLLVCLSAESATLKSVRASGAFAINLLAERHRALAARFADASVRGPDRFEEGDWRALQTGSPTLADALAVIDCRLERVVEHATHAILIGAAVAVQSGDDSPALIHLRSRFEALA